MRISDTIHSAGSSILLICDVFITISFQQVIRLLNELPDTCDNGQNTPNINDDNHYLTKNRGNDIRSLKGTA